MQWRPSPGVQRRGRDHALADEIRLALAPQSPTCFPLVSATPKPTPLDPTTILIANSLILTFIFVLRSGADDSSTLHESDLSTTLACSVSLPHFGRWYNYRFAKGRTAMNKSSAAVALVVTAL